MSLTIQLGVNGNEIDYIVVTNRGPVDGRYAADDWEGGPGVRRYEYRSHAENRHGFVEHARARAAAASGAPLLCRRAAAAPAADRRAPQ